MRRVWGGLVICVLFGLGYHGVVTWEDMLQTGNVDGMDHGSDGLALERRTLGVEYGIIRVKETE